MNNSPLCIDANLVIRLVADPDDERVRAAWERWDGDRRYFVAPALLFYEVSNALYRYQHEEMMSAAAVRLALRATLALPIRLHGEPGLHAMALDLAGRLSLPAAYDAHYLALAEWLGAEFWTGDRRLVRAVAEELPWVHALDVGQ